MQAEYVAKIRPHFRRIYNIALNSIIIVGGSRRPFLGRLPKVDLIILEGRGEGKMSVRTSVRPYVRPQKVSSISMKFGM